MSIEWDHAGKPIATVDSVEKSNGGIVITSSLNRSVYNDIFEKLKGDIDEAKDRFFHPYIIDDVHSATKEFINARYGTEKRHRDSMVDAMAYYGMWQANEKSEKKSLKELLKEREEELEQAKHIEEMFKRMLWNSHYGICQPSELIDSCERIDKYRKEEESMEDYKLFSGVLYGYDLTFDVNKDHRIAFPVDVRCRQITHVYDNGTARPVDNVYRIRLCFNTGHGVIRADFYGVPKSFRRFIEDVEKRHKIAIAETGFNGRFWSAFNNRYIDFCKAKETKDMSRNVMLKNIVGSDIYVKMNDGSNDVVYVGRGQGLDFDIHSCGELTGTISFVADNEPLSDEMKKIGRSFIKKVIFNNPATIVFWRDGSKTIVKMNGKDKKFDPEKGLAMAIAKKCLGNEGNYYNTFTKFLPEEKAGKKSAKK